jgi:hypothetical protein
MAGLVPAIHALLRRQSKDVDARHKAGHDEVYRLLLPVRATQVGYSGLGLHKLPISGKPEIGGAPRND